MRHHLPMGKLLEALFVVAATTASAYADDGKDLLAEGAGLQADGEFAKAQAVYERLATLDGYEGQALYLQAFNASLTGDYDKATELVLRATAFPGKHETPARLLYADLLARQGDTERAKMFYTALAKSADAATKKVISNRLAALEKQPAPTTKKVSKSTTTTATATTAAPSTAKSAVIAKQFPGYALYKEAREAYDNNDLSKALQLAQRSVGISGSHQFDAKLLYADCLFKMGDHKRSKDFLLALGNRINSKQQQTLILKRVKNINRQLNLPDDDGVTSPNLLLE